MSHTDLKDQPPMRIEWIADCGHQLAAEFPDPAFASQAIADASIAHQCPSPVDAYECGATSPMGYRCNRQPGHPPDHEHQIIELNEFGEETTRTIATWPNLTLVNDG